MARNACYPHINSMYVVTGGPPSCMCKDPAPCEHMRDLEFPHTEKVNLVSLTRYGGSYWAEKFSEAVSNTPQGGFE